MKSVSRTCEVCGAEFTVPHNRLMEGRGRFCSRYCRSNRSIPNKFWSNVNKDGPVVRDGMSKCWEWRGSFSEKGYGVIFVGTRGIRAHRVSYELHNGPLGDLHCCHHCDNTRCVNPNHLFAGTAADNCKDKESKGRGGQLFGSRHAGSKLTEECIIDIRSSGESSRHIAARYGVTHSTILLIRKRNIWRHVD